ncbi:hypothetical protein ANANG_G00087660 [Anguilla anguilla]|uniref:Immunoglobulin domain-containing protein n=1 Tax=Anguilla anguilla TaxID=7936 RepID=A0A9D3S1A0_ANGAN|nr:hypothetical protein ANANG_G00087660 [Anguilla anguilla]
MRTFLALILTLTGAHCKEVYGPDVVTGLVGHTVTIPCRYDKHHRDRVKYWCAGRLRSACVKMASTDGSVTDSRVSIRDQKPLGVFNVTIASLVIKDTGWYQCAIKRSKLIIDDNHRVYLNVSIGSESGLDTAVQNSPAKPVTIESSVAGVWAVIRWILLSLMLACFFTVTWWKRSTCRKSVPAAAHTLQGSDSMRSHVSSHCAPRSSPMELR